MLVSQKEEQKLRLKGAELKNLGVPSPSRDGDKDVLIFPISPHRVNLFKHSLVETLHNKNIFLVCFL